MKSTVSVSQDIIHLKRMPFDLGGT